MSTLEMARQELDYYVEMAIKSRDYSERIASTEARSERHAKIAANHLDCAAKWAQVVQALAAADAALEGRK